VSSPHQFCTLLLDGHVFTVPLIKVQEVIQSQQTTRVPLAPDVVSGIMNLRGQIVSVIDLRRRLGLPERPPEHLSMNIVVRTSDGAVSFLVDEIGDVLEFEPEALENPPAMLHSIARDVIRGVYKLPDRLAVVLDIDCLADIGEVIHSEISRI
jgi:purine-binding chemotaxis protein CheW